MLSFRINILFLQMCMQTSSMLDLPVGEGEQWAEFGYLNGFQQAKLE
jgi:hypothetical protein